MSSSNLALVGKQHDIVWNVVVRRDQTGTRKTRLIACILVIGIISWHVITFLVSD